MTTDASRYWLPLILAYFVLHFLLRVAVGAPLTESEATALEAARILAWSYEGRLPLYTWLQHGAVLWLGETVFAVALVKNAVMAALAITLFLLARLATTTTWAWLVVLSLMLLPEAIWTSQHSLTDDLLATAMAAFTALCLLMVRRHPSLMRYLCLGLAAGLGAISAPSYLWFLGAFVTAAISIAAYRPLIVSPKIVASFGVLFALAALPYNSAFASFEVSQTGIGAGIDYDLLVARAADAMDLVQTAIVFCGFLIAGLALAFMCGLGPVRDVATSVGELRSLMARTIGFGILMLIVHALATGAPVSDPGALLPVLFFAAPATVLFLYPLLSRSTRRSISKFAAILAFAILAASPTQYGLSPSEDVADRPSPQIQPAPDDIRGL